MPESPSAFEIWTKYEDVAMHFNGLLIQFRAQIGGAIALLVTLGSYIAESKIADDRPRYLFASIASAVLATTLLAAASMDLFYYSRLLETVVDELVRLESRDRVLQLSTTLRREVGTIGRGIAGTFYFVAFVGLASLSAWAAVRYRRAPPQTSR